MATLRARRCDRKHTGRGGTLDDGGHNLFSSGPHGCYQVSEPSGVVLPSKLRSRRHAHTEHRAANITRWWTDGHPRPCVHICIIRASSRSIFDVIAISSHRSPDTFLRCVSPVACTLMEIASQAHAVAHCGRSNLRDSDSLRGCAFQEAVALDLRTVPGGTLGRCFTAAAFARRLKWRATNAGYLPHGFDAASQQSTGAPRSVPLCA
jgi:hypothetical protein